MINEIADICHKFCFWLLAPCARFFWRRAYLLRNEQEEIVWPSQGRLLLLQCPQDVQRVHDLHRYCLQGAGHSHISLEAQCKERRTPPSCKYKSLQWGWVERGCLEALRGRAEAWNSQYWCSWCPTFAVRPTKQCRTPTTSVPNSLLWKAKGTAGMGKHVYYCLGLNQFCVGLLKERKDRFELLADFGITCCCFYYIPKSLRKIEDRKSIDFRERVDKVSWVLH